VTKQNCAARAQAARHSTYAHVTVRQGQAVSDIIDLNRAVPENA